MSQPAQQQKVPGVQSRMDPCRTTARRATTVLAGWPARSPSSPGRQRNRPGGCDRYAREGADVLITYLNEHDDAKETARLVEEAGRKASWSPATSRAEHCREIIAKAVEEFGRIDVLVNNAAFQMNHESLEEISDEEWDHTFATNLNAMFRLQGGRAAHGPGSSIIGTTSINSDIPKPVLRRTP